MDKDDWIGLGFAVSLALCGGMLAWALVQPQPAQQWTMKIEYTPPAQVKP